MSGRIAALMLFSFSFFPLVLFAHGTGASIEKEVGNYVVDIGYEPAEIAAGKTVRFDFALYESGGAAVPFDRVWLRIEQEGEVIFAGGIARPTFGATGALVRVNEAAPHTLFVRFQNGEETLAELETDIAVAPGEGAAARLPLWASALIALALFLGALGIGALLGRRMRRG